MGPVYDEARQEWVIAALVAWGAADPAIRALILTSSRAIPDAPVDRLSDYDLIVVLADVNSFLGDERWLHAYGTPLVRFNDCRIVGGHDTYARLVLYEDGTKIDYTLWSVALLQGIATDPQLPDELDAGFRILLDKDGLTSGIADPTYSTHTTSAPPKRSILRWWRNSGGRPPTSPRISGAMSYTPRAIASMPSSSSSSCGVWWSGRSRPNTTGDTSQGIMAEA